MILDEFISLLRGFESIFILPVGDSQAIVTIHILGALRTFDLGTDHHPADGAFTAEDQLMGLAGGRGGLCFQIVYRKGRGGIDRAVVKHVRFGACRYPLLIFNRTGSKHIV